MYYPCQTSGLLADWFEKTHLLELYASVPVRTAYDCAPKRCRAQFLCLLNRAAIAEAKKFSDCVRGNWPVIMQTFPELGLWRDLRDAIHRRVWDTTGEPPEPEPAAAPAAVESARGSSRSRSRKRSRSRRKSRSRSGGEGRKRGRNRFQDAPDAEAAEGGSKRDTWYTRDRERGGDRGGGGGRYAEQDRQRDAAWDARWSTSDDPGYDPSTVKSAGFKDKKQSGRDRKKAIETHPEQGWRACRWGRKWRGAIAAMLPSALDKAALHTDFQVRKLGAALWKDLAKWLEGTDSERVLGLFRADNQTPKTFGWDTKNGEQPPAARGLEPGTPACDWSFIPVVDLIQVIGEGVVGSTTEGMFAANPLGHKRCTLAQCYKGKDYRNKRKAEELVREVKEKESGEAKSNGRSKWDQGGGEKSGGGGAGGGGGSKWDQPPQAA